jgi:hypothetical protein
MDDEKNSGVTESRFALTLLICLLFAVGYVALLRLAGPKDTAPDTASETMSPPLAGPGPTTAPPPEAEPQPVVLPIEKPTDSQNEISQRPKGNAPQPERR